MPLVSQVGRRTARSRIAMTALYVLLCLGAVTTVYPFLLMIATGFKNTTDQDDNALIPKFWTDSNELEAKYLHDKYAGNTSLIDSCAIGNDASPDEVKQYNDFLLTLPPDTWMAAFRTPVNNITSRLTRRYQEWLMDRFPDIETLNKLYIEENVSFRTVTPPNELFDRPEWRPAKGQKWLDWLEFKAELPAEFRIPVRNERMWQEYLRSKFENQMPLVPKEIIGKATKFEEIRWPSTGALFDEFMRSRLPKRFTIGSSIEERWAKISNQPLPIRAAEQQYLTRFPSEVRSEMSWRNYSYVLDFVALHGRALLNTAIFCVLSIVVQLTVNPLAAYALSRYPIRASGKILLFLLATMAFPAEVAMIPSFLLLKDLGLLNTFAALVLPAAASGYMIFLLKGFFDSLPQEIFESGQIDGAPEMTMFRRIALPLCKPVLGYLSLLAFMGAYGAFMYAFLVAQDQRMWTLMVWIYQLQSAAPKAVMMAALTIAALPTLLVFLLSQRVIMRGIVLPGER